MRKNIFEDKRKRISHEDVLISLFVGYCMLKGIKYLSQNKNNERHQSEKEKQIYTISCQCVVMDADYGKREISFVKGNHFRVLFQYGDIVVIEKLEGGGNPYIVSAMFLSDISNFTTKEA